MPWRLVSYAAERSMNATLVFNLFWYPVSINVVSAITRSTQLRFFLNPDCSTGTILIIAGCIRSNPSLFSTFEVTLNKDID